MSWSGSFRNDRFTGPGTYQAENGVRCFVDMASTPGPVTVDAPVGAVDHNSFLIEWDNPNRESLTIADPTSDFDDPSQVSVSVVPSVTLNFRRGMLGFTLVSGIWELFNWNLFGVALTTTFAIAWKGQATNGICTLVGQYNGVEVERTAEGFYTVRLAAGTLDPVTMITDLAIATGLPSENSPELRIEDVGNVTPDEILINSGLRNKNGQFSDDDLVQDPGNFVGLVGQRFP